MPQLVILSQAMALIFSVGNDGTFFNIIKIIFKSASTLMKIFIHHTKVAYTAEKKKLN